VDALQFTVLSTVVTAYNRRAAEQVGVRDCRDTSRVYVSTLSGWVLNSTNGDLPTDTDERSGS